MTRARALRAITEELMVDPDVPSAGGRQGTPYTITTDVIKGKVDLFEQAGKAKKESA